MRISDLTSSSVSLPVVVQLNRSTSITSARTLQVLGKLSHKEKEGRSLIGWIH